MKHRRYRGEGEKDQRGNNWLKPEGKSMWHALCLALPNLPTTSSFYKQNSVKPCGVVLLINFVDQDFQMPSTGYESKWGL